jgi:hypothetical protein
LSEFGTSLFLFGNVLYAGLSLRDEGINFTEMMNCLSKWQLCPWPLLFALLICPIASGKSNSTAEHWAFSPISTPEVPVIAGAESAIDAFVRVELERRGISPAPAAKLRELFRRLSFDLNGLPPTFAQSEAFAESGAIDEVVDRLLAASSFGEKWARHWLDVARYADTKGYVFQEERRYPFAYGYRDWVIQAFNSDMPYDEFVIAQLAADSVPDGKSEDLAAMGFVTLGRRFLNREPDIIDDRIDVVTRGMLGLTVACSRCHDHKFDPIPTEDYYSLYGVFQSSIEPSELPLVGKPDDAEAYAKFEKRLAELESAVSAYKSERHADLLKPETMQAYLKAAWESRELTDRKLARYAQDQKLYPAALSLWQEIMVKGPVDRFGAGLWRQLNALSDDSTEVDLAAICQSSEVAEPIRKFLNEKPLISTGEIHSRFSEWLVSADFASADEGIAGLSPDKLVRDYSVEHRNHVRRLQRAVDKFRATDEGAPTRAMALIDRANPVEPVVFERGNPANHGAKVKRQFLSVLSPADRQPFSIGSGRLELAQAIADPDNPLTARVMVNRVWMHLMGSSLVDSPSDFGVRTLPPKIPGLLDYLAAEFIASDWSMKQLIRSIVLSETYQQSTQASPEIAEQDPDNRLYARASRKRLPFESLRDAMLTVSGNLDPKMFGRAVDMESKKAANRKTIYGFVDRQNLPGMFRTFDFAGPDAHCPQRHETTVPQQALYLMNNVFAQESALGLAQRALATASDMESRIVELYRLALARDPDADEIELGESFLVASREDQEESPAWQAYAQALLASNEFAFCD